MFYPRWCRNIAACCVQWSKFDTSRTQLDNALEHVSTPATSELVDSLNEMMNDCTQIQWIDNSDDHARTGEVHRYTRNILQAKIVNCRSLENSLWSELYSDRPKTRTNWPCSPIAKLFINSKFVDFVYCRSLFSSSTDSGVPLLLLSAAAAAAVVTATQWPNFRCYLNCAQRNWM